MLKLYHHPMNKGLPTVRNDTLFPACPCPRRRDLRQLLWSSDSTPAAVVPSSALYYPVHVSGSPFDVSVTPGIETNADAEICGDSHANATANNLTATFTQAKV